MMDMQVASVYTMQLRQPTLDYVTRSTCFAVCISGYDKSLLHNKQLLCIK